MRDKHYIMAPLHLKESQPRTLYHSGPRAALLLTAYGPRTSTTTRPTVHRPTQSPAATVTRNPTNHHHHQPCRDLSRQALSLCQSQLARAARITCAPVPAAVVLAGSNSSSNLLCHNSGHCNASRVIPYMTETVMWSIYSPGVMGQHTAHHLSPPGQSHHQ